MHISLTGNSTCCDVLQDSIVALERETAPSMCWSKVLKKLPHMQSQVLIWRDGHIFEEFACHREVPVDAGVKGLNPVNCEGSHRGQFYCFDEIDEIVQQRPEARSVMFFVGYTP